MLSMKPRKHQKKRQPPKMALEQPDYFVAVCRAGLEEIVAAELIELGCEIAFTGNRMVAFHTDLAGFYSANMALRAATKVMMPIRKFRAKDTDILYYQTRKVNWPALFSVSKYIRIDVKGESSAFPNTQFAIHRIKDAIVDTFKSINDGERPSIEKEEPDIQIVAFIDRDEVTLYLDGSGAPLFKRGYREEHGAAPLKEDLAAGLLLTSPWDQKSDVIDPMCGSGTLLAEAYLIANNIAPNVDRTFAFEHWNDYDESIHRSVHEKLTSKEIDSSTRFYGIEIDRQTFKIAQEITSHPLFGDDKIQLTHSSFQTYPLKSSVPFLICNPPYGIRLEEESELNPLYHDLGAFMRKASPGGHASIFTAAFTATGKFSLKPMQRRKFFNGSIPCRLYSYEMRKPT